MESNQIRSQIVKKELADVYNGFCPICGGRGPVDIHTSYRIWSAGFVTSTSTRPRLSCRRCALNAKVWDLIFSAVLGWWAAWGIFLTPVYLVRNLYGLTRRQADGPSDELEKSVRVDVYSRYPEDEEERRSRERDNQRQNDFG